jgi:hypothetical protein
MLLTLWYSWAYLAYPETPGRRPLFPLGWWGWFDQSRTLMSATALSRGDLSPARHWYPLGYAVIGAPFIRALSVHAYFFIDLAALLVAFAAFCRFARQCGIPACWSVAVFLFATLSSRQMFDQWAIPWNTTPAAALTWLLLALVTTGGGGRMRAVGTGVVAGCIPLFRPTDAVLVGTCLGVAFAGEMLVAEGRAARRGVMLRWCWLAAGGVPPVLAYAALHLAIYGPRPSEYMRDSRAIGFTFYDLPWKAYVILLDPRAWFGEGEGLMRRCPWIALAIAGLVPALRLGRPMVVLAAMLAAHAMLYLSYVDLLPTGLWRFDNVHYFVWAMPGYGLLGFVLLRDLARPGRRRWLAVGTSVTTAALLCVRLEPMEVPAASAAKMLVYPGLGAGFDEAYFAKLLLRDVRGELASVQDLRAFPAPGGLRVIALRRPFAAGPEWVAGHAPDWPGAAPAANLPPTRWAISPRFGWPCWLLQSACASGP